MTEPTKVTISEVEQALMQALKKATEAGYIQEDLGKQLYSNSALNAVGVYSSALQRILSTQR